MFDRTCLIELGCKTIRSRGGHRASTNTPKTTTGFWSSHPPSDLREIAAKTPYIAQHIDGKPAWSFFKHPALLQQTLTEALVPEEMRVSLFHLNGEELTEKIDRKFDVLGHEARYHGLYFERPITRAFARAEELVDSDPQVKDLKAELDSLSPDHLADVVRSWRQLNSEIEMLQAVADGSLQTPGRVFEHNGQKISRRRLPGYLKQLKTRRNELRQTMHDHDRQCRSVHRAAGLKMGQGWGEYHLSLLSLLHYVEHAEADLRDSHVTTINSFTVAAADGVISGRERRRLVKNAIDLRNTCMALQSEAAHLELPRRIRKQMHIERWSDEMAFAKIPKPDTTIVLPWLQAIEGWLLSRRDKLEHLRTLTQAELLIAERIIEATTLGIVEATDAPQPVQLPKSYGTLTYQQERRKFRRFDAWTRFKLAHGVGPSLLRNGLAASVLSATIAASLLSGTVTLQCYNSLNRSVDVDWGDRHLRIEPGSSATVKQLAGPWGQSPDIVTTYAQTKRRPSVDVAKSEISSSTASILPGFLKAVLGDAVDDRVTRRVTQRIDQAATELSQRCQDLSRWFQSRPTQTPSSGSIVETVATGWMWPHSTYLYDVAGLTLFEKVPLEDRSPKTDAATFQIPRRFGLSNSPLVGMLSEIDFGGPMMDPKSWLRPVTEGSPQDWITGLEPEPEPEPEPEHGDHADESPPIRHLPYEVRHVSVRGLEDLSDPDAHRAGGNIGDLLDQPNDRLSPEEIRRAKAIKRWAIRRVVWSDEQSPEMDFWLQWLSEADLAEVRRQREKMNLQTSFEFER